MTAKIIIHKKTKTVTAQIPHHLEKFKKGIRLALFEIGKSVVNENVRLINSPPKTGKKHSSLPNRSSAPHEAPATQSGKLAKSTGYKVRSFYQMEVGETAPYAKFLEDGTRRMAPRTHLLKAVNNEARNTQNTLEEMVSKQIGI